MPDDADAVVLTRAALADAAVPAIFGATVADEGATLCRCHALVRLDGDRWRLEAVRAATKVKAHHRALLARQARALRGAGVDVAEVTLLTLDRRYLFQGGALDPQRLFVAHRLGRLEGPGAAPGAPRLPVAEGPVRPGSPMAPAAAVEPVGQPLTWLPGMGRADAALWRACGVRELPDLGADGGDAALVSARVARGAHPRRGRVPGLPAFLTSRQRRALACHLSGARWVSPDLPRALASVRGPVHALDFETYAPPLPRWPGTAPYQAVPTQFSLHIHRVGAPAIHRSYLHADDSDPRRPLAEALLTAVEPAGTICVYSSFEARVIRGLAQTLPDRAEALRALLPRLRDLHPVVRRHVVDPGFRGSTSLKRVASALVEPDPYAALPVRDGLAAQQAFARALDLPPGPARAAELDALRRYCAADTLALVELWRCLSRLVGDV